MDYPIHIDKIGMNLSFLYFKGLLVKKSIKMMFVLTLRDLNESSTSLFLQQQNLE